MIATMNTFTRPHTFIVSIFVKGRGRIAAKVRDASDPHLAQTNNWSHPKTTGPTMLAVQSLP